MALKGGSAMANSNALSVGAVGKLKIHDAETMGSQLLQRMPQKNHEIAKPSPSDFQSIYKRIPLEIGEVVVRDELGLQY